MDAPLDNKLKTCLGRNNTHVKQPESNAKRMQKSETSGEEMLSKLCLHHQGLVLATLSF